MPLNCCSLMDRYNRQNFYSKFQLKWRARSLSRKIALLLITVVVRNRKSLLCSLLSIRFSIFNYVLFHFVFFVSEKIVIRWNAINIYIIDSLAPYARATLSLCE